MNQRTIEPLSLRPREAARALGICTRTLWALTAPRGPLPCIKLGNGKRGGLVLYRVEDLDEWLRRSARRPVDLAADESVA